MGGGDDEMDRGGMRLLKGDVDGGGQQQAAPLQLDRTTKPTSTFNSCVS